MSDDNCTCCPQHRTSADRIVESLELIRADIQRTRSKPVYVVADGKVIAGVVNGMGDPRR